MLLFIFGLAIGSFVNVIVARYDPERPLFNKHIVYGRSHCPKCKQTLRWFELIPLISYGIQRGRCRHCHRGISIQYPVVEAVSGFLFFLVPQKLFLFYQFLSPQNISILSILWILAFLFLLIATLIDLEFGIIPDETEIAIAILACLVLIFSSGQFVDTTGSFIGPYALLFGFKGNIFLNHLFGSFLAAIFFGGLIAITKGRGMGFGDLKLGAALGFLFGWPDILFVIGIAFIVGACVGGGMILAGKKTGKATIPFGPFLALASFLIFFLGYDLMRVYFSLLF